MSIKVNNVIKLYGEQKALDNVSFEINPGEIVGFLGPNGAGKSTMMKIIACYIPQSEGAVEVCGYDVTEDPLVIKQNVGYLPEHNPLYLEMYVREYLEFIAGIHKLDNKKQRVDEMIDKVGLETEQHKQIEALSKGYRQRVGLAQALIHDPAVLVLDEPTTGLDPNQIVEIRNLIKTVGKHKTVMMSTHIMQEVEAVCDRVLIINHGKIVADQSASEIKKISAGKNAVRVEFSGKIDEKKLKRQDFIESMECLQDNCYILTSTQDGLQKQLFRFAVENDLEVLEMRKEEKDLEAIFKSLTK